MKALPTKPPKFKRAGPDGEIEIKFPSGRKFLIRKQLDQNLDHERGMFQILEWDRGDWEWHETTGPKAYAKEVVLKMGMMNKNHTKLVADYSSSLTKYMHSPISDKTRTIKFNESVEMKKFKTFIAEDTLNENALKALRVATKAHKGQFRKSGGEYIDHPKEVARFVKQFKKSNNLSAMVQAAYLHDTLEDTDTTYADLVKQFGALVADMVQALTTDKEASDAIGKGEYIANKMAKMSSWALVVKLADRLANVQDIDTRPEAFQKKYASDTRLALKRLRSDRYLSKTHNKIMSAIEKKIKEY